MQPRHDRPPAAPGQALIQSASGGLAVGAIAGLAEASFHLATTPMPDAWALPYGVLLYGAVGLGLGVGVGVVLAFLYQRKVFKKRPAVRDADDAMLFAWGGSLALVPVYLFVGRYLVNKVVYAEQGVPLPTMAGIAVGALVLAAILAALLSHAVRGPLRFLTIAPGLFGGWVALAVVAALPALLSSSEQSWAVNKSASVSNPPRVLYIMVDTLRADALGAYGKEDAGTPHTDALAADGVVFEKAYAHASWTRASGASQFSGRIPSGHDTSRKAAMLPPELDTWPEVLQTAGYATGALINNINLTATFGFNQGFDVFVYEAPDYPLFATEGVFSLTLYKVVHKLHDKFSTTKSVTSYYQPADVVFGDAMRFIQSNPRAPWALFVHLMEPHDPFFEHPSIEGTGTADYNGVGFARAGNEHPDPAKAPYLKSVYASEVKLLDRELGDFLASLKAADLYDDTLIVYTSDHGEEFYEHGGWWHGTTLYEEQVHVPLIVKYPKQRYAGTRIPFTVRHIDLAPTLAEAAGATPGQGWEGSSLTPAVQAHLDALRAEEEARVAAEQARIAAEEAAAAAAEAEAETEADDADDDPDATPTPLPEPVEQQPAPPDPCDAYAHPLDRVVVAEEDFEGNVLSAIRKGGFKLIRANAGNPRGLPEQELFDLLEDPAEQHPIVTEDPVCGLYTSDRLGQLTEELELVTRASAAGGAKAESTCISDEEIQRLIALGYMQPGDDDVKRCE